MVLDTSLLDTQHYKVPIKGKVEQSRERSSAPLHLGVVAIEKGAFGSHSTTVANFTYLYRIIKVVQDVVNLQCSLNREPMLHMIELVNKIVLSINYSMNGEGGIDHRTIIE